MYVNKKNLCIQLYIFTYIEIYIYVQLRLGFGAALIDLYVGLGERDHLWQDFGDMQILHLVPLPVGLVQYVDTIGALLWIAIVHNIGHQIIFRFLQILVALLHAQNVAKVHISAGLQSK